MNTRFGSCSQIPTCQGRDVLFLLIEVDPHLMERIRECLPEGVRGESREFLEKLYLAEDHWRHHHRIPRSGCGEDVHCR